MTDDNPRPSEVRALILAQHDALRVLYAEVDELLSSVLAGDAAVERALRERCRVLYQTLLQHMATEDAYLAPALRQTDGFGPLRAHDLLDEHDRQRRLLRHALSSIDERSSGETLLQSIPPLLVSLRADMAHEEHALLNPDLLKDDAIEVDTMTG
jgi:iron-sulfur cluster repair protein YtfE (RIC family)